MTRVAYLCTRYPALSHTFIEREVRAVRARGVEVHTFSIRPPTGADLLSARHVREARTTWYVLQRGRLALGLLRAALTRPWALLRALAAAQRLSPPGLRARALHCAYAVEAVVLAHELRARDLRHLHVHMATNAAAVALLATVFDRTLQYSLSIHGSEEFFDVRAFSLKSKVEGARFVRCISHFCRAQVMAWSSPEAWPGLHVVPCGLAPEEFAPAGSAPRDGPLRILTVGRLDPIKGYDLLLEACERLAREGVDFRLRMVGEGPMRERLESLVRSLGLGARVELMGALSQEGLRTHHEWAHVLVVSSFMEGIPVVLMEAMAKELAVVSTRVAGIPELVEDGASGLLVSPSSAEALLPPLRRLAAEPDLRAALGRRARARIREGYSVDEVGRKMARLLETYAGEEDPARDRDDDDAQPAAGTGS